MLFPYLSGFALNQGKCQKAPTGHRHGYTKLPQLPYDTDSDKTK